MTRFLLGERPKAKQHWPYFVRSVISLLEPLSVLTRAPALKHIKSRKEANHEDSQAYGVLHEGSARILEVKNRHRC